MNFDFYGAKIDAIIKINQYLNLPATGKEQDWEFEFADPKKIPQIFALLIHETLDLECRSALALLLIASIEEAEEHGLPHGKDDVNARAWLLRDEEVRERMQYFWMKLKKSTYPEIVGKILQ